MNNKSYILLILWCMFSCNEPIARRPKTHSTTNFHKEVIAQYRKMNALENKRISNFIDKDTLFNYKTSTNGFWYAYVTKDTLGVASTPKKNDVVVIEYDIKTLNNHIIYDKQEITYKIDKQDFIPGLQEGIKLMKEGEKMHFIIPSYSAYGVSGDGHKINRNQPIKSILKLIKITKSNENN